MIITFKDKQDYIKWVTDNIEKNNKIFDELTKQYKSILNDYNNLSGVGKAYYFLFTVWSNNKMPVLLKNITDRQKYIVEVSQKALEGIDSLKYFPDNITISLEV